MKLPEKILYCRKRQGLSQEALAEQLGVSRQAVSKWETGEAVPELSKLALLAKTFSVTADWLISEDEPEPQTPPTPPPVRPTYSRKSPDWMENLPGQLGRFIKRYGWLSGFYLCYIGIPFLLMGLFSRFAIRSQIQGGLFGEVIMAQNPVFRISNFFLAVGIGLILLGIALALFLKMKSKK